MSTNYGFQPTLDGLNSIDSNSTTSDDIVCNTLKINVSGTAPTMPPNNNSTHIATTAYVDSISGSYVTTNTTQTITGQKTFSNANTFITGNTVTSNIQSASPTTNMFIGQNLTTGDIQLGTTSSTGVGLSWGSSSNSGQINFQGGSFSLLSSGIWTERCGSTQTATLFDTQTTGVLNIATASTRSGAVNIANNSTATNNVNIANLRSGSGIVTIGSNNSTTNTLNLQSNVVNVGTVSPILATNTVNIGNGQNGSTIEALSLLNVNDSLVLNSGNMYTPLGTSMVVSAPGLTDDLTLIGGNTIALIGTTTIDGTLATNGQTSAGSIMTNTYNPFLATADVNINPTQTSGSLNLGTKIDRSGIIQIGNGVNATCDIRIGTARTTGGTVSVGSNSSIANTLNLQSALINVGTGSPVGTANTVNIGNGNAGSLIDLKNDTTITGNTNINITGTKPTSIGNLTGNMYLYANDIFIDSANSTVYSIGAANRLTITNSTLSFNVNDTNFDGAGTTTFNTSSQVNIMPVATIIQNVSATVPSAFLYCDGTAVSRSTYANLFAAIGTSFGVGNGTTTFNVPNFRGAFLRGASSQVVSGVTYSAAAVGGTAQLDMALTTPVAGYATPFVSTGFRSCGSGTRDCLARTSQGDTPENPTGLNLAYPTSRSGTEVRPMNYSVYYYIRF